VNDRLPAEVIVTELPDGVRYTLPPRPLGDYQCIGLWQFAFGVLLCCVPLVPLVGFIRVLIDQVPPGEGMLWLGGFMLGLPIGIGGGHVAAVGLFVYAGHSEVEVRGGMLYAIERWGLLRWTWERSAEGLRRLHVGEGIEPLNGYLTPCIGSLRRMCVITPEWKAVVGGPPVKSIQLAPGYPREWLAPLTEDLSQRCLSALPGSAARVSPTPLEIVAESAKLIEYKELAEQPAGSKVQVESSKNRLVLTVPPNRLGFYLYLALGLWGVAFLVTQDWGVEGFSWPRILLLGLPWVMGGVFLAVALSRRRRAVLAVIDDTLLVWETNLFRERREEWQGQQVADVYVNLHSDDEGEDYWDLRILLQDGTVFKALPQRDPSELRWIATTLRRALGCQGETALSPPPGLIVQSLELARHLAKLKR
jgi:hypothetical protein